MTLPVSLLALSTAVPPHRLDQADVARRTRRMFERTFTRFPQLDDVFVNAGIAHRYTVCPPDWFDRPQDFRARTKAYLQGATALFVESAGRAIAAAGIVARDIDVVVTISSTGIATPSLEARVGHVVGLRPDVKRVPVFGLGCAGGVSGLALGAQLARGAPGALILVVVIELCTLAFRRDRGSKADVIATALFGDGAAAAILCADDGVRAPMRLGASAEHTWPGTLDIMGWSVDPIGFGVVLSRALPRFVEERLAAPARRARRTLDVGEDARLICHPGGSKVLAAVEAALSLDPGTLADERAVLRDYGNMSAPTVMFVIERALKQRWSGSAIASALGPGFTASFLAVEASAPLPKFVITSQQSLTRTSEAKGALANS
jgi:alkylresorcinol/alkylpyrone synthase